MTGPHERMRKVYAALVEREDADGHPPSQRALAAKAGLASSTVFRALEDLEEAGRITRDAKRRPITVRPDPHQPDPNQPDPWGAKSSPKADRVRNYINGKIEAGTWEKGFRVPACSSLGAQLGCDHSTVAKEIKAMIDDGILYRLTPNITKVR